MEGTRKGLELWTGKVIENSELKSLSCYKCMEENAECNADAGCWVCEVWELSKDFIVVIQAVI